LKTLAIVSGGDAPGINTTLAHFTILAARHGHELVGAHRGFEGLLAGDLVPLTPGSVVPWAAHAGSLLPSSRVPVLKDSDSRQAMVTMLERHAIDNVLLFGGDGSLRHLPPIIEQQGVRCIGLPTTIDNDVAGTERTLGFDSACNFAYQAIDGALATAHALSGRIFMIETLGGYTGMLALDIAYGAGAHAVLVPEYAYDDDWLARRLVEAVRRDGYALLVLSEGVAASRTLAADITGWTQIRVRDTRLGHSQRGATPSHRDRVLAADMARIAFEAMNDGVSRGTVVVRDNETVLHEGSLDSFAPKIPDSARYNAINGYEKDYEPSRH
jgi:6-phosphofructokinase 1